MINLIVDCQDRRTIYFGYFVDPFLIEMVVRILDLQFFSFWYMQESYEVYGCFLQLFWLAYYFQPALKKLSKDRLKE